MSPRAASDPGADASPYDALLLVSFGGPEGPDDVLPFLENVTRGRGIPRERLLEVGEHYFGFGGVSPINAQNRALVAALQADFAAHGVDLPVYWGNRNWAPYLTDELARLADDGRTPRAGPARPPRTRRTPAAGSTARTSRPPSRRWATGAPHVDRIRHYFNHPGFVEAMVTSTVAALEQLPAGVRQRRAAGVRHALDPDGDGRDQRTGRPAPTAASTATSPGWSPPGSPR